MFHRVLRYLRSQALGLVAIFIALGGTGYAAISIPKHSIGRQQLKKGSVGTSQLRKHSVSNAKIRSRSIDERALADASVGSRQLRKGSVGATQIRPGTIGATQLGAGSVGTAQLAAGSVTAGQLAAGSVGTSQLAAGSVGSAQIAAGSVGPSQLSGVALYVSAFAVIEPSGAVSTSDPAAATTGWSDGSGMVTFTGTVGGSRCIAVSSVPAGADDGSAPNSLAHLLAGGGTVTQVLINLVPATAVAQETLVEIECLA
jgi:trimeric autotransporter adhesin